jgi:hypothetical protein
MFKVTLGWPVAGVVVVLFAGCGAKSTVSTVPVSGTVTFNGAPLEGADVILHTTSEGGHNASGRTDSQGKFTLSTYISPSENPEGALPGSYKVSISKMEASTGTTPEQMMQKMATGGGPKAAPDFEPKSAIPEKYRDPTTSGLTATVPEGGDQAMTIDLK